MSGASQRSAQDNWVKYVEACERCSTKKGPFGGVYARDRRMAVCEECYTFVSSDPKSYREQVERYLKRGV